MCWKHIKKQLKEECVGSMKMKVCHMTSVHGRYDGRILEKECITLSKNGYDVTLLVNDQKNNEIIEGVKIISTMFKPQNRVGRILGVQKVMYLKAIEIDADVYHFHDPELIPVGNRLKRMNKKVIFDSHEDTPVEIEEKIWIPRLLRKIISTVYRIYEKHSIGKYDALISVTPHVVDRFLKSNSKTVMITNYPLLEKTCETDKVRGRTICFAGAINETWKHESIIKAIDNIEKTNYILAGPISRNYLKKLESQRGWKNVDYRGEISKTDVLSSIYLIASVGIALNYSKQLSVGGGTLGNNKFFEYMQAKLPIICSDYKLWKDIVEKHNCGLAVDPNNEEEIKNAIKYMLDNPDEAKKMGENGHKAMLKFFNWEEQGKALMCLYESLEVKRRY